MIMKSTKAPKEVAVEESSGRVFEERNGAFEGQREMST
jgi:hypothetical protein